MRIRHNEIYKPPENPFANCKLQREPYAEILTSIVEAYPEGFVMALDNEWGTGKTTFVKMWQQKLINNEFKTIYFNAWENDFEKDPFVALISELEVLEEKKQDPKVKFQEVVKKAGPLSRQLAISAAKSLLKKHIGKDFSEEALNLLAEKETEGLEEEIAAYKTRKKDIESFKDSLTKFVKSSFNGKPLIFIIDELDRCRPSYAVELLEQIKHIFSVPKIVFVLSIDKKQLGHAICGFYGSDNLNSEEYLRRFIDVEYSIPEPDRAVFCDYLFEYFEFKDTFAKNGLLHQHLGDSLSFYRDFFKQTNLALRQIEKIFSHASLALKAFNQQKVFPNVFLFLIFIKQIHPVIYKELLTRSLSYQQLVDRLEETVNETNLEPGMRHRVLYTIGCVLISYQNFFLRSNQKFASLFPENNQGDKENSCSVTSKLNSDTMSFPKILKSIENNLEFLPISYFTNKIDLIEPLKF